MNISIINSKQKKLMIDQNSPQAQRLFALCKTPLEKEIAKMLFCDVVKTENVADMVGYSERQIYRIKKKLKERLQKYERG